MKIPKEMRLAIITAIETTEELCVFLDKLAEKSYDMTPQEMYPAQLDTIEELTIKNWNQ